MGAMKDLAIRISELPEAQRRSIEYARGQACAYVWGRQDAGEAQHDTGYSLDFGEAFSTRKAAYIVGLPGLSGMMPNLEDAFREWRVTGDITEGRHS